MEAPNPAADAVTGVLLAAGRSNRFESDSPKQLVDFRGEPMIHRVARRVLASRLDRLIVVVGYCSREVSAAVSDLELAVVENPAWETGMASSVRTGLAAAQEDGRPPAVMFIPADQPLLGPELIDRLLAAWSGDDPAIVQPRFRDRAGAPVLWSRSLFAELAALRGEGGGRQVIARCPELVQPVELADEMPLLDVDTSATYRELLGHVEDRRERRGRGGPPATE